VYFGQLGTKALERAVKMGFGGSGCAARAFRGLCEGESLQVDQDKNGSLTVGQVGHCSVDAHTKTWISLDPGMSFFGLSSPDARPVVSHPTPSAMIGRLSHQNSVEPGGQRSLIPELPKRAMGP